MKHFLLFFLAFTVIASADPITIRGRLTDLAGEPAAGLRIMSAAQADSVVSEADGRFEMHVDPGVVAVENSRPTSFALSRPYPNPGRSSTSLALSLPHPARVAVHIYNVLGQRVRTLSPRTLHAGRHTLHWDLRDDQAQPVARGLYMMRISVNDRLIQRKVAVVPGSNAAISPSFVPLAKPSAELALFISDPRNRYHEHIEYIEVNGASLIDDIQISVNRKAELRFAGADTISAIVGHVDSVMVYMDDDEPISRNSIEITTKFNHLALDHTLFEDSIRVRFTPRRTGADGVEQIRVIFSNMQNGDSDQTILPFDLSYRFRIEDALLQTPVSTNIYQEDAQTPVEDLVEVEPGVYKVKTDADTMIVGGGDILRTAVPAINFAHGDSVVPTLGKEYHDRHYLKNLMFILNTRAYEEIPEEERFAYVVAPHPGVFTPDGGMRNTFVIDVDSPHYDRLFGKIPWLNTLFADGSILDGRSNFWIDNVEVIDNKSETLEDDVALFMRQFKNPDDSFKLVGSLYMAFNNHVGPAAAAQYASQWVKEVVPEPSTWFFAQYHIESPDGPVNVEDATSVLGTLGEVDLKEFPDWARTLFSGAGLYGGPDVGPAPKVPYAGQEFFVEYIIAQVKDALPHGTLVVSPRTDDRGISFYLLDARTRKEMMESPIERAQAHAQKYDPVTIGLQMWYDSLQGGTTIDRLPPGQLDFGAFYKKHEQDILRQIPLN